MVDTLPRAITGDLLAFCAGISEAPPSYVPSVPAADAVAGFCFDNVAREVERHGGEVVNGWAVWHFPGLHFEAEHHGLWRAPAGDLVDVSPQPSGASRMLFLPDVDAVYDPMHFRSNILQADPVSRDGARFVQLARRRNEIIDRYRAGGATTAALSAIDQETLTAIMIELNGIVIRIA